MNLIQPRGCRNCSSRTVLNRNLVCTLNPPTAAPLAQPGQNGQMQLMWVSAYPPISDELPPCSFWKRRIEVVSNDADIQLPATQ